MWVEAFFEVFTTALLAYFMVLMGFVSHAAASRIVDLATLLFLGSGLLGISHNFYWNAKPVATLAIGSIFSTLQVVPLILLTLEAVQFPQYATTDIRRPYCRAAGLWPSRGLPVYRREPPDPRCCVCFHHQPARLQVTMNSATITVNMATSWGLMDLAHRRRHHLSAVAIGQSPNAGMRACCARSSGRSIRG